jgi:uncharacterized protein (UPF0548 family)
MLETLAEVAGRAMETLADVAKPSSMMLGRLRPPVGCSMAPLLASACKNTASKKAKAAQRRATCRARAHVRDLQAHLNDTGFFLTNELFLEAPISIAELVQQAAKVPKRHWRALFKTLTGRRGRTESRHRFQTPINKGGSRGKWKGTLRDHLQRKFTAMRGQHPLDLDAVNFITSYQRCEEQQWHADTGSTPRAFRRKMQPVSMLAALSHSTTFVFWPYSWELHQWCDEHLGVSMSDEATETKFRQIVREHHESGAIRGIVCRLQERLVYADSDNVAKIINGTEDDTVKSCLPRLEVRIEPGEAIFFTSDLFHAGASWTMEQVNYRLHAYFVHAQHRKGMGKDTVPVPSAVVPMLERQSWCAVRN